NGVAVQQLTPPTALRNSERVVRSWHGRKVADDENRRAAAWAAQKRDYARLGVVRVDPLEACGLEVDLVQRRLGPIERIERGHPPLDARVLGFVGERPVELRFVRPLAPLRELSAHEKELLARVAPHEAEEGAQVRKALPAIAWHLADERALAVHDFVV